MQKICIKCKTSKNLDSFSLDKKKKDGHGYVCKECHKHYMTSYYQRKKNKWKGTKVNKKKTVEANKQNMLGLLSSSSCKDCGNKDVRVLEFDHLRDKKKDVSVLVKHGYSWTTILNEIDKCEIVCANCHRIRTIKRQGGYKNGNRGGEDRIEDSRQTISNSRTEDEVLGHS